MRLGVDLDNTIVCYDGLFHRLAVQSGLVPAACPADKQAVRDFLRRAGREADWTRLQGRVYGPQMREAPPFAGALEFFQSLREAGWEVWIISHRSRQPYLGEPADLHQAARDWLSWHGFTDPGRIGLPPTHVVLEESLEGKLQRIALSGCQAFIDDLPEVLLHEAFPAQVERLCFDPAGRCSDERLKRVTSWQQLSRDWFPGAPT